MDANAGLTKRSGLGVETATARALVGLGYAALYLLVLTGARLWAVPALYVVALIVLVKIAMDDFNYIVRETPNRIAGLLVALSLGRVAMLVACDVFLASRYRAVVRPVLGPERFVCGGACLRFLCSCCCRAAS